MVVLGNGLFVKVQDISQYLFSGNSLLADHGQSITFPGTVQRWHRGYDEI